MKDDDKGMKSARAEDCDQIDMQRRAALAKLTKLSGLSVTSGLAILSCARKAAASP